jgi:hypothetical protein
MFNHLGFVGVLGLVLVICGLALIAIESLLVAFGLFLVLLGVGLAIKSLLSGLLATFGMDGMF